MSLGTFYVPSGGADWSDNPYDATATLLNVQYNSVVTPSVQRMAYAIIDTSALPNNARIISARLYWRSHAYTASRGVSKIYNVWIFNGAGYDVVEGAKTFAVGWQSSSIPSASFGGISLTANSLFRWTVEDPGPGKSRLFQLRAYEYAPSPDFRAYLIVQYREPVSRRIVGMVLT